MPLALIGACVLELEYLVTHNKWPGSNDLNPMVSLLAFPTPLRCHLLSCVKCKIYFISPFLDAEIHGMVSPYFLGR